MIADLTKRGEIDTALKQSQPLLLEDITNYHSPRKIVVVEGAPGVGKTTLAYKLCRDWANWRSLADYWLVLYIPLRVPLMRLAESADDLLQHYGKHCSSADIQLIKQKRGQGVLFVLDGWDELRPSCRVPSSFFHKFMCGEFLPESSIIVTSRPGAVTHHIRTRVANRLVEILGFTADQVTQYIQLYFKDHKGAAQKLAEDLQMYPNVGSTCYVAINLTILCYVYLASGFMLPPTLTEVYEQFVIHTIKHHYNRQIAKQDGCSGMNAEELASVRTVSGFDDTTNKILKGLGRLALSGLDRGDLSFTNTEVTQACNITEPEFDGFGLLKVLFLYRMHGTERNYQFLHLTVQEYLAAYTIFEMKEQEQAEWLRKNISNGSCDMVLKFFSGMDRFNSRSARKIFYEFITAPLVLECVFEAQWEEACHVIAQETSNRLSIIGSSSVQPYRALVYAYVMTKSGTQWQLQWQNCVIGENDLKSMSRYLLHSPKALTQISLNQATFASKEATKLFSEVIRSQVELSEINVSTQLDDESLSIICQVLEDHQTLQNIKISQNRISRGIFDVNISAFSSETRS